ncbi:hypothetical protein Q5P01_020316 [Channa striata]|uniref:Uncharacterized protein n=1 Tax=Channa striata TaxID=64152 RepID=A0AA88S163_CHASR|nr:hypothetical protein Q5P01_020316 [Channa striata]
MGSTGSRPRLHKVAPCNGLQLEGEQLERHRTLPARSVTLEQLSESLGSRKTTLPPLKQEITHSTVSEPCFTGSLPQKQINYSSIIQSHPPRKPQALQPLPLQIGHTSANNSAGMTGDCTNGGVSQFSTIVQPGHVGSGRMIQGAYLEAQTALTQQAHRERQAHLRQARELGRHKVVHKVNGQNTNGIQRQKPVRRCTERDIFWDETAGKTTDPSCFLEPKSLLLLCEVKQNNRPNSKLLHKTVDTDQHDQAQGPKNRQGLRAVQQTGHRGWTLDKDLSWTTESVETQGEKTKRWLDVA